MDNRYSTINIIFSILAIAYVIFLLTNPAFSWLGTDFRMWIANITNAGSIYLPFTITGQVYNNDLQIDYYTVQYRIYATDETWNNLEAEIPVAPGSPGITTTNNITSIGIITKAVFTAGAKYQFRVWAIDLNGTTSADTDVINIPEGGDGDTWEDDMVKTSTIGTGVKPK